MTLFDAPLLPRREGSRAVEKIDLTRCPCCGLRTERIVMEEPVLFRHGGYGATRRTVTMVCAAPVERCRWSLVVDVTEVRP